MRTGFSFYICGSAILVMVSSLLGCKKLVSIPPPVRSITSEQVFSTDQQAAEAMVGVYNSMINTNGFGFFDVALPIDAGASADEFNFFQQSNTLNYQFQLNNLLSSSPIIENEIWSSIYSVIYGCNSVIEGTETSVGIHDSVKNELIGEAEFTRAFSNFYLVNLFGEVPLVTTINYNATSLLGNASLDTIYALIISDLKDAQSRLPDNYSVGHGQRIVPNKWAVTALLARVYLFRGDWADADDRATAVINETGLYQLVLDLNSVFLTTSNEAIWQLQQSNQFSPNYNATPEGYAIIPIDNTSQPLIYMTPSLINAFDSGDNRRVAWVDSTVYGGTTYYFPFKYKNGPAQAAPNGTYNEYYMALRLGEQYLIKAEAEANGATGGIAGAITDLNAIRSRAGLPGYSGPNSSDSVLNAIYHEREVELFSEWGHRWLDLKRWNLAQTTLSAEKGITVTTDDLLYPIPNGDILKDPNLKQNPGY